MLILNGGDSMQVVMISNTLEASFESELNKLLTELTDGLKVDELAALNYYMMKRSLEAPVNATFIKERMNLDVTQLGVDGILQVQRALVNVYVEQLAKDQ